MSAGRRVEQITRQITSTRDDSTGASLGTLRIGPHSLAITPCEDESRLPRSHLLDPHDPYTAAQLSWLLSIYLLKRDVFLISAPGPYARRLVLVRCWLELTCQNTFASLANIAVEHISLHRDVSEAELKQSREIRKGGTLEHVDSAVVRAAKHGRWLILEGIERAERGVLPTLNSLVEAREVNLESGEHIVAPAWYDELAKSGTVDMSKMIRAHDRFRVWAIGAPVPPFVGNRLDPPFRSRFAGRFLDPSSVSQALARPSAAALDSMPDARWLARALETLILTTQHAAELSTSFAALSPTGLRPFPQTALQRMNLILAAFPPRSPSPDHLARLLLTLHPALSSAGADAWTALRDHMAESDLGPLGDPHLLLDGAGLLGYRIQAVERTGDRSAKVTFVASDGSTVAHEVACGMRGLAPWPLLDSPDRIASPRFMALLTTYVQLHALGLDVLVVPPVQRATASCSTTTLVETFAELLGYEHETVHLYKELSGREIIMRRTLGEGGTTGWEPAPLIEGALAPAKLVTLAGIDSLGPTAASLARLFQDRESTLWEGRRLVPHATAEELELDAASPSFRIVATSSKATALRDYLTEELCNMAAPLMAEPMDVAEEMDVLARTGVSSETLDLLTDFAARYRVAISSAETATKHQGLGTRALLRVARRLALTPWVDPRELLERAVLFEFWPLSEKQLLLSIFEACNLPARSAPYNPPPRREGSALVFPGPEEASDRIASSVSIPIFTSRAAADADSNALIPTSVDDFYDNSSQNGLMRDLAIDLFALDDHVVLLGNQGTGKNRVSDRLLQLLDRPREFIQLHRDTTVSQLLFQTSLTESKLSFVDSPLLRAVALGHVALIDECDKASPEVVAVIRSLAERGEMSLPDGRRVRRKAERTSDIQVHPAFRMILLGNRPSWPFMGNAFVQVLADSCATHSAANPDLLSERRLLAQMWPDGDELLISKLVHVFQDLRIGHQDGTIAYPFSLRELINLVKHLRAYPQDPLQSALRSITDFDVHDQTVIDFLASVLAKHHLAVASVGLAAVQDEDKNPVDVAFDPTGSTELSEPKFGKLDDKEHHGGGRDTAGVGGRGGFMRLIRPGEKHQIHQVSDELKQDVPEHIKARAREMAKAELARKLAELDMSSGEAGAYLRYHRKVAAHITTLTALLENLEAQEDERVWMKRKTDGELDDQRIAEGLSGESTIFRRRGSDKPEAGRPQMHPKRIRFVVDVSASMYRFQYDGRMDRSLEAVVLIMEAFARVARPDKYVFDIVGHSGDGPEISLVTTDAPPKDARERYKVLAKMSLLSQMAFSGDHTVEALEHAADVVAEGEADDRFVIAISDAPFTRYGIDASRLRQALNRQPKVKTALILVGEDAAEPWVMKAFPSKTYSAAKTEALPLTLRTILTSMVLNR